MMKKLAVCLLAGVMLFAVACAAPGNAGKGGTGADADDYPKDVATVKEYSLKNGVIDADMASYMQKHEIINLRPVEAYDSAILGNGIMGVAAYQEQDSFVMNIGRGDIFGSVPNSGVTDDLETLPSMGQVRLKSETEFYATATGFEQRLSLYNGLLTTEYATGITKAESEMFVYAAEEGADVLVAKYEDRTPQEEIRSLEYSIWEGRNPEFSFDEASKILYITEKYPSKAASGGYTVGISVSGIDVTYRSDAAARVAALDFSRGRTSDCIFFIASAEGYNQQETVKNELMAVQNIGYDALRAAHVQWWNDFFSNSFISLSQGGKEQSQAEYLESLWYFNLYLMASGARYEYPFKFNGGLWNIDKDYREWGSGYWNWNTRVMYWPLLTAGKTELMKPYFSLYSGVKDRIETETSAKFEPGGPYYTVPDSMGWEPFPEKEGIKGVKIPETMDYDGSGVMENQYVFLILSTGADISMLYQWYYKYTLDEEFLKNEAYPLMKGVADFMMSYAGEKGADGKYHFKPSNGREQWWNVSDAADAVASCRALLQFLLSVKDVVGADGQTAEQWQEFLENLVPQPSTGSRYLPAGGYNPTDRTNSDNPETEIIFPYGLSGIGADDYAMALRTYLNRQDPMMYGWTPETVVSARLGLGDETFDNLQYGIERFQVFSNGMTHYQGHTSTVWNRMFYTEYNGVLATTVNEMLLQSYNGVIRVFPAVPEGEVWKESKFTLYAEGGFRVTSEINGGNVKYVAITSTIGGKCRLADVFGGKIKIVDNTGKAVSFTEDDGVIEFDTQAGGIYTVCAAETDLSAYTSITMTAEMPTQPKRLGVATYGKFA